MPFLVRQKELEKLFHFTCACSLCALGQNTPQDKFTKPADQLNESWVPRADAAIRQQGAKAVTYAQYRLGESLAERRLAALQGEAFDTLEQARKDQQLDNLREVLALCTGTQMWPLVRQPLPATHQQAFLVNLASRKFEGAFIDMMKLHFLIDPLLYPEAWHPVRVAHTWTFAMLARYMSMTFDPINLLCREDSSLQLSTVYIGLMLETWKHVPKSHGVESQFGQLVKLHWQEFLAPEGTPRREGTVEDTNQQARLESWRVNVENEWVILKETAENIDMSDTGNMKVANVKMRQN